MSGGTQRVAVRPQQLAALADRFDESRAYELVQRLAGEEFSGRQTGTAGSRAAGDFLSSCWGRSAWSRGSTGSRCRLLHC